MSYTPLFKRYSDPPPGWEDNDFIVYQEFAAIGAGTTLKDQPLTIPPDADFYWRGFETTEITPSGGSGGGVLKLFFRDAFGNELQNVSSFLENIGGTDGGGWATPIFPEIFIPKSSFVLVTITEYGGVSNGNVQFHLIGVQRYPAS